MIAAIECTPLDEHRCGAEQAIQRAQQRVAPSRREQQLVAGRRSLHSRHCAIFLTFLYERVPWLFVLRFQELVHEVPREGSLWEDLSV